MAGWTAQEMPDLQGRVAVVTGATSGLGVHIALELARRGAEVTLPCQDENDGERAIRWMRGHVPDAQLRVAELDLADLGSVRRFAAAWDGPLDLLVNNAAVMAVPRKLTANGFEPQFGINYLGHFALTGLLLGALLKRRARVVTMSSHLAALARINFADLQGERRYGRLAAYGQSKLATLVFALELHRRAGGSLLSVAAHPGYAATNLQVSGARASGRPLEERVHRLASRVLAQPASAGARPALYAASASVTGGGYYAPRGPLHARGAVTAIRPPRSARSRQLAARLWAESERLTGVSYDALRAAHSR